MACFNLQTNAPKQNISDEYTDSEQQVKHLHNREASNIKFESANSKND